jgi:hypothetical protein
MHSCPIFIPGHSLMGSVARLLSSSVTCPENPGGGVRDQPEPPERALALQPRGQVVGQRDDLVRAGQHELAGVQDERLVPLRLHQAGQIRLLDGGVDVRVPVILEHPEVAVEAHVDTRRLHHGVVEGIDADPPGVDLGPDVLV